MATPTTGTCGTMGQWAMTSLQRTSEEKRHSSVATLPAIGRDSAQDKKHPLETSRTVVSRQWRPAAPDDQLRVEDDMLGAQTMLSSKASAWFLVPLGAASGVRRRMLPMRLGRMSEAPL